MSAELLRTLMYSTLYSSLALLCVGLLRHPLRSIVGACVAYWLWLLVPAMTLAVLLPVPSQVLRPATAVLPAQIHSALAAVTASDPTPGGALLITIALTIWLAGATVMLLVMFRRQRIFTSSLGALIRDSQGLFRSEAATAPLLIGAWRSRIVVPADFEARYTLEERSLVLAHEHAHDRRRDVAVNALASFAVCLFWFNPLVYRALAWLRMDQELACDALVLSRRVDARHAYATALLKAQLATESAWRMPIGCHWQSYHPLKERILMLKRPLPGVSRRIVGMAFIISLAGSASYAAWAGSTTQNQGPPILVNLKVTITNPQSHEMRAMATQYLVHSGEEIADANARPLDFACTPFLPDEAGRTTDWSAVKTAEVPAPAAGQVLMVCAIRKDGRVNQSPAVIAADGKWATIETAERGGPSLYKIELNASTSAENIAAAKKAVRKED